MKKSVVFIIVSALFLLLFSSTALACTVFSGADEQNVLFGNNEDWLERDTYLWFVPESQKEYGRVCFGFENAHPQGGLNDQGLAIDWVAYKNATDDNLAPVLDTKKNHLGDINDALLSTCAGVDVSSHSINNTMTLIPVTPHCTLRIKRVHPSL
jgi:penicillin V acylase-like amidase (Ntn superfamily)